MITKIRSILIPFVTVCLILGVAIVLIAYGRGYRFSFSQKSLQPTGLLTVTSEPNGAQILVNGKLKTATNATISLSPDWYTVTISKEGFQSWEKKIQVQGEVVARADALLLPTNPSLTAITASGVANPSLSPDGSKLVYVIPNQKESNNTLPSTRPGVWVLDLVDKPLGLNRDARQIAKTLPAQAGARIDFSKAALAWSPDNKQVLACITTTTCYLLETDNLNETPILVNNIKTIQNEWKDIKNQKEKEKLATLQIELVHIATSSMKLVEFSPDESKFLYEATKSATIPPIITLPLIGSNPTPEARDIKPGNVYVYDIKEDRNYLMGDSKTIRQSDDKKDSDSSLLQSYGLTVSSSLQWLPTSRHFMLVGKDKIEIMDYDGTNRRTGYAGPFWDSFAVPWTNATKIVILTNLNSTASAINNLYAVNLR